MRYILIISALTLATMLLLCSASVLGQQQKKMITVNEHGEMVVSPEAQEMERHRREMLNRPDFLILKVEPSDRGTNAEANESLRYRAGTNISFTLFAKNTLTEPIRLVINGYEDRPKLTRDGDPVPYLKRVQSQLESHESAESMGLYTVISSRAFDLQPNVFESISRIDLKEWYGQLEPGHYQLTVQHRFINDGNWIEFPAVTFDVVSQ